ncbi:iron chelate uptake ABC transporter family permease subunit [Pseudooceanicola aestuarii]|uniref:iron chelate uptake ABC transporter family permease subunit n=1 Tax=Pseudooceanicola aestuarii TaxID=2697319 RepID=UPI0013D22DAF|nr:iron chelate uptake ABC transporter family permease subunit [Pseudooceanicola aestuarii]
MAQRLAWLALALAVCTAGYMGLGLTGPLDFILPFRATKLAALLLVAVALAVATVLFQTLTANRILTPSLMGFDALYVLVLTGMIYGSGVTGYAGLSALALFVINLGAMAGLGLLIFTGLMRLARRDMMRLVLSGIVLGMSISALSQFLQRLIDPSEYQLLQAVSFARFTQVEPLLLGLSALTILPALVLSWRLRHRLDVLALGRETAQSLGEPPQRLQRQALLLICVLVGSATALVGPFASGGGGPSSFFGLIAAAFAYRATPSHRHAILLPSAALTGAIILVGGQLVMERVLHLATPLTVVIELIGGATFLYLLLKRRAA